MRRSRWRCGKRTAGFITRIHAAGFSGIAATSWVAAVRTMNGKSNDGARYAVILRKSGGIARAARSIAVAGKDKHCCIGLTTREKSDGQHRYDQDYSYRHQRRLLD